MNLTLSMSKGRYLFDHLPRVRSVLRHSPRGLITDVDGTISLIVTDPQAAQVSPRCAQHLTELVRRLDLVAAISGRPAAQARDMVGVDGLVYVGNHGLEWWQRGTVIIPPEVAAYRAAISSLRHTLATNLNLDGVLVEDKGVILALHYRQSPHPEATRQAILEVLSRIPAAHGLRVVEGRKVIELRPPVAIDKGTTIDTLIDRYHLRAALYLGDDETDADAFRALKRRRGPGFEGLAIGVWGEETPSSVIEEADLFLNGVEDVERFLGWVVENI